MGADSYADSFEAPSEHPSQRPAPALQRVPSNASAQMGSTIGYQRPLSARSGSANARQRAPAPTMQYKDATSDEEEEEVVTPQQQHHCHHQARGMGSGASTPTHGQRQAPPQPADSLSDSWEGQVDFQRQPRSAPDRLASGRSQRSVGSSAAGASPRDAWGSPASPQTGMRQRTQSASHERAANQLGDIMARHPSTWDNRDVALWVDLIGMGQYKKKFLHNAVDGRLLQSLTDGELKEDLGIGPLGHRKCILDAIASLSSAADNMEAEGSPETSRPPLHQPKQVRQRSLSTQRPLSARPASAKPAQEWPRRPASASRAVIPPDPYLGPVAGKVGDCFILHCA